jgi:hypothetical protein
MSNKKADADITNVADSEEIFEPVDIIEEPKKKQRKKRKPLSAERKAQLLENLKRGRETSKRNRQANAKARKEAKELEKARRDKIVAAHDSQKEVKKAEPEVPDIKFNNSNVEDLIFGLADRFDLLESRLSKMKSPKTPELKPTPAPEPPKEKIILPPRKVAEKPKEKVIYSSDRLRRRRW